MSRASDVLATASREIDRLAERAAGHHAKLEEIRTNRHLSDEGKRQLMRQERETFEAVHRQSVLQARCGMDEAKALAARHLSAPGDADTETRKSRAAMRVSRLIDAGTPAGVAAELFAEAGDLDALRALRDEVPSWVAVTLPTSEMYRRTQVIEQTLLTVDRYMAPLLSGEDAAAVEVRLRVDEETARLQATSEHATNNTADSRVTLAYAAGPAPELPAPPSVPSFASALVAAQSTTAVSA